MRMVAIELEVYLTLFSTKMFVTQELLGITKNVAHKNFRK